MSTNLTTLYTPPTMSGRDALLDDAHRGNIYGALGTIRVDDTAPRTSWLKRIRTLLAIMGPGLIVMVGDNDAGGVSTYAQAGQNYGTGLLWTLLLLIPVLIVNQEMVVRLGLVTGVGHARLILERFGKFWGAFSVGDLFLLNFLTIMTEFIGISLGARYFGISPDVSVPVAAVLLIAITVTGSFRRWERAMYLCVVASCLAIPLAFRSHPQLGQIAHDILIPQLPGGINSTILLLIISIVGTTVAPWQLFFQQSNVIDKRLTPRWMAYERADTIIGAFVVIIGAGALMSATAFAFGGTKLAGQFGDASTVAAQLAQVIGPVSGGLMALVLLNAGIIGACAVTLASSYAFGDVFGVKHSLHRSASDGRAFYLSYSVQVLIAAGIVLIPHAPLGLIVMAVQALAGVLLPSASVFLLLLCNDKAVLGPWVNAFWLNCVATVIVGVLVALSLILAATTLFPTWDLGMLTVILGIILVCGMAITGVLALHHRHQTRRWTDADQGPIVQNRLTWRMPPLSTLSPARWSITQQIAMITLRAYLLVAVILLAVRVVQLAMGH